MTRRTLLHSLPLVLPALSLARAPDDEDDEFNEEPTDPDQPAGINKYWEPETVHFLRGSFAWTITSPLVSPPTRHPDAPHAIKEPTFVLRDHTYHLFATTRSIAHPHRIEYCAFQSFTEADRAQRHVLPLGEETSAPQVLFHRPLNKWLLVFQSHHSTAPHVRPMYATSDDPADPKGWSKPAPLTIPAPTASDLWRDFWFIADADHAYLFYSTIDGRLYRARSPLDAFRFAAPILALRGDFMAGCRIYKVQKLRRYLCLAEARDQGRRYIKAFVGHHLDGGFDDLATTADKPFAGPANVTRAPGAIPWTDSIANGELLRSTPDETCPVDHKNFRYLHAGSNRPDRAAQPTNHIPSKLGLLEPVKLSVLPK